MALLTGLACGATPAVPEDADAPPIEPPTTGTLAGTFSPVDEVADLTAVDRATGRRFEPDAFDEGTGAFRFEDVPGAASYDLQLALHDGRRIEGVDLRFVDADLLELADIRRRQMGLPVPPRGRFEQRDARALLAYVAEHEDFMDIKRPLYVHGWGRRATVLVELMRTRPFHDSGGDWVWRIELWYFEDRGGEWVRLANQQRVLWRERLAPAAWRKIDVTYYPALSIHVGRDGASRAVRFEIPPAADASRGRPSGSKPQLETAPHILGVDGDRAASRPATRPADE
ncbi:MAG: hypothetical protein KGY99_02575 [Phycisphaerae bacterium]|nr:hypothetical protein [Phycisphaerae bacterium]